MFSLLLILHVPRWRTHKYNDEMILLLWYNAMFDLRPGSTPPPPWAPWHRSRPQWPAATRIVSGSGYLAAASSHPHYKYTASDHDINQIRRVNNNGDWCRKLESVLSLSSQFTYFPDTWPRLSDTSWHWGTEGSRDLRWWDNQHRSVLPWSCRRTLSRLWTLNIELRVLILFYYLHTHLPTSKAGIQTTNNS